MDNRYMMVYYYLKPTGKWDEVTDFKKKIKNSDLQTARVILDFKEKKVVKNSLNREASYDDMLEMYKRLLGEQLTQYLPRE